MIEKFNFYDVYGYFLPGAAFLAILWIPFGLVKGAWPPSDWSSAVIVAAIAYFLGHLLQNIATNAIPSKRKRKPKQPQVPASTSTETGSLDAVPPAKTETQTTSEPDWQRIRYPSEYFLDEGDPELPKEVKKKIAELVEQQFGVNLEVNKIGDKALDKTRNNAFLLARQILIQGDAISYAEQFQGMYTITRGLFVVFGLAFFYWLGWFIAAVRNKCVIEAGIGLLGATVLALLSISLMTKTIVAMISEKKIPDHYKYGFELAYAGGVAFLFLLIGYLIGIRNHMQSRDGVTLAFLALCALLSCLRFRGAYDYFAERFASTVWRDFLAYNVKAKEATQTKK